MQLASSKREAPSCPDIPYNPGPLLPDDSYAKTLKGVMYAI
jgi:hypothetical protein